MFNRVIGTFKLDRRLFEEIDLSSDATGQAALIVVVVSLIASLGSGLGAHIAHRSFFPQFIGSLVWSIVGWVLWAAASFFIGTVVFKGHANLPGMLRGIGFSYVPQILSVIPCIGLLAGWLWSLAAGYIAIGQDLKLDAFKTLLTLLFGFGIFILGHTLINSVLGGFLWFLSA